MKIMASGPITSWEIDDETVSDFIWGCSKITADGDWSYEIKRRLLLGRKFMSNLDSMLKSRDITLPTKVHLVKAMVFPVVMSECEGGLWRRLSTKELMLLNCGVGEDSTHGHHQMVDTEIRLIIFFFFLIFIFTLFYFTILYWFCHTWKWKTVGRREWRMFIYSLCF